MTTNLPIGEPWTCATGCSSLPSSATGRPPAAAADYEDSQSLSGGEKAKLAYTILASTTAFQFGIREAETRPRSFRFVILDEAFSKVDPDNAAYAMEHAEFLAEPAADPCSGAHQVHRRAPGDPAPPAAAGAAALSRPGTDLPRLARPGSSPGRAAQIGNPLPDGVHRGEPIGAGVQLAGGVKAR